MTAKTHRSAFTGDLEWLVALVRTTAEGASKAGPDAYRRFLDDTARAAVRNMLAATDPATCPDDNEFEDDAIGPPMPHRAPVELPKGWRVVTGKGTEIGGAK